MSSALMALPLAMLLVPLLPLPLALLLVPLLPLPLPLLLLLLPLLPLPLLLLPRPLLRCCVDCCQALWPRAVCTQPRTGSAAVAHGGSCSSERWCEELGQERGATWQL